MAERYPFFVRLLWWVLYMFLTGSSWMMIYSLLYAFNNSSIDIEIKNTVSYKEIFPFPAVTVCSTTKIVAGRFNVSKVNQKFSNISWDSQRSEILNNIRLVCNEYDKSGYANRTSLEVIQILFQYLPPCMSDVIDSDETFTPILTNHGLCFSNNILDGREMFRENVIFYNNLTEHGKLVKGWLNSEYGFYSIKDNSTQAEEEQTNNYPKKMSVDYNLNFRVKSVPQDNKIKCNTEPFQFKVLLHNPAELPFIADANTFLADHATKFLADQFISISVKPEVISTDMDVIDVDPIKKNCFSSNERNLTFFRTYTERNCFMECLTNLTLKVCKCVTFYMPRLNTTEICSAFISLTCGKVVKDLLPKHVEYCRCKPSCLTLSYNADIFTQHWPESIDHSSNLTVKSSSGKFFVSYRRKNVYDVNALISDVGGINGFFTGLSISSIIQFVYFFIWRCFLNLFKCMRKLSKRE